MHRSCLAAAFVALSTSCGGDGSELATTSADPVLKFSAIPDQDETRLREKFDPVARHLSERLGVAVEYVHATRYSDAVELFKNGDVQLAWFGGLTGVQARRAVPGARAIAQGVEDPEYYSYFIAHRDSGLEPGEEFPEGLEGKRFTFGSDQSTSGRLMPEHFIREATGRSPEDFFGAPNHYSGSHDATCELVESGQFEAGAVNYKVYDRRVAEGKTDREVCRVVWKTPTYADYNFTAHPLLDETYGAGFTKRLQQVLIDMKEPDLLAAFPRSGFVPASNADFEQMETLAYDLEFTR